MAHLSYRLKTIRSVSGTLLGFLLLAAPVKMLAHGGHGDEFGSSQPAQSAGAIQVDSATANRMGLKVEPVSRQP